MNKDDEILGIELSAPDKTTDYIVKMCLYALLLTVAIFAFIIVSFHISNL